MIITFENSLYLKCLLSVPTFWPSYGGTTFETTYNERKIIATLPLFSRENVNVHFHGLFPMVAIFDGYNRHNKKNNKAL